MFSFDRFSERLDCFRYFIVTYSIFFPSAYRHVSHLLISRTSKIKIDCATNYSVSVRYSDEMSAADKFSCLTGGEVTWCFDDVMWFCDDVTSKLETRYEFLSRSHRILLIVVHYLTL